MAPPTPTSPSTPPHFKHSSKISLTPPSVHRNASQKRLDSRGLSRRGSDSPLSTSTPSLRALRKLESGNDSADEDEAVKKMKKDRHTPAHKTFNDQPFSELYSLGMIIGQGATSSVFICTHKKSRENFAVKIIPTSKILHRQFNLIAREIGILRKLNHPGIINLHDCIVTDHNVYIVMELVRGAELFDVLVDSKKFTELEARVLTRKMLEAISYLHKEHVAHRDLKFDNIKLETCDSDYKIDERLNIKILDFGFARLLPASMSSPPSTALSFSAPTTPIMCSQPLSRPSSLLPPISASLPSSPPSTPPLALSSLLLSATVAPASEVSTPCVSPRYASAFSTIEALLAPPVGTLGYEAPEIVSGGMCSLPVDMWALGVMTYTMLCGYPPFMSQPEYINDHAFLEGVPFWVCFNDDTTFLRQSIKDARYEFPTAAWGHVSAEAKAFIDGLLKQSPQDRMTADEALHHPWFSADIPVVAEAEANSFDLEVEGSFEDEVTSMDVEDMSRDALTSQLQELLSRRPSLDKLVSQHILKRHSRQRYVSSSVAARQHQLVFSARRASIDQRLRHRPSADSLIISKMLHQRPPPRSLSPLALPLSPSALSPSRSPSMRRSRLVDAHATMLRLPLLSIS